MNTNAVRTALASSPIRVSSGDDVPLSYCKGKRPLPQTTEFQPSADNPLAAMVGASIR